MFSAVFLLSSVPKSLDSLGREMDQAYRLDIVVRKNSLLGHHYAFGLN